MRQYTLPFTQTASYAEKDFVVSDCNRVAFEQVSGWPEWQSLLLIGQAGCGKTHLGHIWMHQAQAELVDCKETILKPETLHGHCFIDNIEHADQEALFHTINIAKEHHFSLLLSCKKPIKQSDFTLPDLTSRLLALPVAEIENPDDDALMGVMRKQFADRQIHAEDDVMLYALTRIERSFDALNHFIQHIDGAMWRQKKNLTIPFIREALKDYPKADTESA